MPILFIHGRAQQGRNSPEISDEWLGALNKALKKEALAEIAEKPIVPFYGDYLFKGLPVLDADNEYEVRSTDKGQFESFVDEYVREVARRAPDVAAATAAANEDPDNFTRAPTADDYTRTPTADPDFNDRAIYNWPWVVDTIRAIDRRWPHVSAGGIARILKDVYDYLTNKKLQAKVDDFVIEALPAASAKPLLIVAHSLGSVVLHNLLVKGRIAVPARIVTVGSPLGINAIRHRLDQVTHMPNTIKWWANYFDKQDIVALNAIPTAGYPGGPDILNFDGIRNPSDNHHHITGYLDQKVVAKAIHQQLT